MAHIDAISSLMQLISTILHSAILLPHFLRYYQSRGITHFIFHVWGGRGNPLLQTILGETRKFRTTLVLTPDAAYNGEADSVAHDAARRRFVKPGEWYAICDLDEFHVLPGYIRFQDATRDAEADAVEAICGQLVDRVTSDGTLPLVIQRDCSLASQFPCACDITQAVVRGCTQKVQMAKGLVAVRPGHHSAGRHKAWNRLGEVHHFKWLQSTIEEQRRRVASYHEQGLYYQAESVRLLSYLAENGGRIRLTDPRLNARVVPHDPIREM